MADDDKQKSITIVGRIDVQKDLSADELDYFENAWDSIIEFFTVNTPAGKVRLLGREHKAAAMVQVRAFKANTGLIFEGNDPVNGFGLDVPIVEDVMANAANNAWPFTTAAASSVIASRWTRNWLGLAARDTTAGFLANSVLLRDVNNDPWSLMLYGVMDMNAAIGYIDGYVPIMNNRARALIPITPWTNISDISFRDMKRAYHVDPITPIQVELQWVSQVATAIQPYPVSTTCRTARRALQRGTQTRPTAA